VIVHAVLIKCLLRGVVWAIYIKSSVLGTDGLVYEYAFISAYLAADESST
jgi:hypothetical protein